MACILLPQTMFNCYFHSMFRLSAFVLALGLWLLASSEIVAGEYRLTNGDVIRGQPISYNEEGAVFRLDVGGMSPRISWTRFTQEALRELAADSKAAPFADPFIEIPPEVKAKERERRQIVIKDVPKTERPERAEQSLGAFLTSPIGLAILAILYLANLYAAYEISFYRDRPPALVIGLSAILPVIAPIGFLFMAPASDAEYDSAAGNIHDYQESAATPAAAHAAAPAGGGLSLSAAAQPGSAVKATSTATYKRGDTTFNRRFFESTLPGFFRVVPSEAEKDLVLAIKGARAEYVAKRISRISSNELHLQTQRGEVMVPFAEIMEVQVRHKDGAA
jgi:hypothetical protein